MSTAALCQLSSAISHDRPSQALRTSPASQPYRHQPLQRCTDEIRLFRISPQSSFEQPSLQLEAFEADHTPQYRAVSYEWGSGGASFPVLINGQLMRVQRNLFEFLQRYPQARAVGRLRVYEDRVHEFKKVLRHAIRHALNERQHARVRILQEAHNNVKLSNLLLKEGFEIGCSRDHSPKLAKELKRVERAMHRYRVLARSMSALRHGPSKCLAPAHESTHLAEHIEYLWVDQICIDQGALRERNHQVQLMSQIFQQAFEVIAWLGPSAAIATLLEAEAMKEPQRSSPAFAEAKQELVSLPFWGRLWVQQELLLSRELILMADESLMSCHHLRSCQPEYESAPHALQILLRMWRSSDDVEFLPLTWAIALFSNNECSEVRDKMFGILGMVHPSERVEVNYSQPLRDLFCAALEIATHSKSRNLLPSKATPYAFLRLAKWMGVADGPDLMSLRDDRGVDLSKTVLESCGIASWYWRTGWRGLHAEKSLARRTAHLLQPPVDFMEGAVPFPDAGMCREVSQQWSSIYVNDIWR